MAIKVEIDEPGRTKRFVNLNELMTTIGRSSCNKLVLGGDMVSSRHAVLKHYHDGLVVEDVGSSNGTFINDRRVTTPTPIANGTCITFGCGGPSIRIVSGSTNSVTADSNTNRAGTASLEVQTKSRKRSVLLITGTALACCLLFAFCVVGVMGAALYSYTHDSRAISSVKDQAKIQQAVGKVVVGIEGTRDGKLFQLPLSVGTGFLISPDGYIVTNKHVIEDAADMPDDVRANIAGKLSAESADPRVWITFGEITEVAEIVFVSQEHDFSVLKISRRDSPYFRVASVAEIPRLASVYALGFPDISTKPVSDAEIIEEQVRSATLHSNVRGFFKESDFDYDSTSGTVSRVRREQQGRLWIQHNAPINGGNSGGPLCLENGLVVGINTLSMKDSQGVFFALALSQLNEELEKHEIEAAWTKP